LSAAIAPAPAHATAGFPGAGYMPQLDTLRAFAVTLVIVSHWLPKSAAAQALPLGMIGVTLFFVLSGFLITGILLAERRAAGDDGHARRGVLWRFYARRTLRIFPVYYLLLLVLWIAGSPQFRADFGWYAGYASNVLMWREQAWLPPAPHLWTLAVEEQFYLTWPLLMLYVPRAHLGKLLAATLVLGPVSRIAFTLAGDGSNAAADFAEVLTPSCLDAFGLGALLAAHRGGWVRFPGFERGPAWLLLAAAAACVWWLRESYSLVSVLFRSGVSVLALGLIALFSAGVRGPWQALAELAPLRYFGRISYGVYLFHFSTPALYAWLSLPAFAHPAARFLAHLALLLALAALSWHAFERPILALKRRFGARRVAAPADAGATRAADAA
jgi:peptidoglycan/LPS O-acetylase OafA/YrhL